MTNLTGKLLLAGSIVLATSTATADWYAGASVYNSTINETDFEKYSAGYDLTVGWSPESNSFMPSEKLSLAAEGSYHNLGTFDVTTTEEADASAWSIQGVLTFAISEIDVYGKLGISYSDFDGETISDTSVDPYVAAGVAYSITEQVDIYGEYQNFELTDDINIFTYGGGIKAKF